MKRSMLRNTRFSKTVLWFAALAAVIMVALPAWAIIYAPKNSVITRSIAKGAVTSTKIRNGTIINADVAAAAAIAASKINRAGLDADTLDGKHASGFIQTSGNQAISGNLQVQGLTYETSRTGKTSIAGMNFEPETAGYAYQKTNYYLFSTSGSWYTAPLNLPDGVTLKYVGLQSWDSVDPENVELTLYRWSPANNAEPVASIASAGNLAAWQYTAVSGPGILLPQIDNNYAYYFEVRLDGAAGSALKLGQVMVMYEYKSPN